MMGRIGHDRSSDASVDAELIVSVNVSPELQPRFKRSTVGTDSEEKEEAEIGQLSSCKLTIELSSYATLSDIQVCVDVCRPLMASKDFYVLSNLCERSKVEGSISVRIKTRETFRRTSRDGDRRLRGRRLAGDILGGRSDGDIPNGRGKSKGSSKNRSATLEDHPEELPAGKRDRVRDRDQKQRSSRQLRSAISW